jgi:hypothetical protein
MRPVLSLASPVVLPLRAKSVAAPLATARRKVWQDGRVAGLLAGTSDAMGVAAVRALPDGSRTSADVRDRLDARRGASVGNAEMRKCGNSTLPLTVGRASPVTTESHAPYFSVFLAAAARVPPARGSVGKSENRLSCGELAETPQTPLPRYRVRRLIEGSTHQM